MQSKIQIHHLNLQNNRNIHQQNAKKRAQVSSLLFPFSLGSVLSENDFFLIKILTVLRVITIENDAAHTLLSGGKRSKTVEV